MDNKGILLEKNWWGNCTNTSDEEAKQLHYASMMGLDAYHVHGVGWHNPPFNLQGKSVLDIGGGPVSLLLKCKNVRGTILDPIKWPDWVHERYEAANIKYVQNSAELYDFGHVFDEVWIYNVLQHVKSPTEVLATALRHGKTIRIWEWLGGIPNDQHPHVLDNDFLDSILGTPGQVRYLNWENYLPTCYANIVHTQHLIRKPIEGDITVTITSCGRFELLKRTIETLRKSLGKDLPIFILDDSEKDKQHNQIIEAFEDQANIFIYPHSHGHAWALDTIYHLTTTPYIFHCEDDWEFLKDGYLEKALTLLEASPEIGIVGLAKNPQYEKAGAVGEKCSLNGVTYYDHPKWRISDKHDWWNGSILSPSLRRRKDFVQMPFSSAKNEADWDSEVWAKSGLQSVWLDQEYVKHIGQDQSVKEPTHSNWLFPESVALKGPEATMPLHFISTDSNFPYTYYLGILSALKTQNVTKVHFWCTVEPKGPYFKFIRDQLVLHKLDQPNLKALEGKDRKFKAAHIKDYLLWGILYEYGGLYLDLDTLSIKDITYLMDDREIVAPLRVKSLETHPWPLESAILMVKPKSSIIKSVKQFAEAKVKEEEMAWADMAYIPLSTIALEHLEKVRILSKDTCIPYCGGEVLYNMELPVDTHILHLQGSHLPEFISFNEENVETDETLYARTIRSILSYEERHPKGEAMFNLDEWCRQRGERMRPMFEELASGEFRTILEVGTYDGENALKMIEVTSQNVPIEEIHYYGFDLFEPAPAHEMSWPNKVDVEVVRRKLESTGAQIHLFKGDTKETLRKVQVEPDFVFIDGGHSIETIRSDWEIIRKFSGKETVIYLDDYYPELPVAGCKFLEQHLEILPTVDIYDQPWGKLKIQLARAKNDNKKEIGGVNSIIKAPDHRLGERPFRFHLLGLPHVPTHPDAGLCAYTQKVVKMGTLLKKHLGHKVFAYVGEGSKLDCDEMVVVATNEDRIRAYGDYNWYVDFFKFDANDHCYRTFNENAIREISKRGQPGDFILMPFGYGHKPVYDEFHKEMFCIESGIGYRGIFAQYRVFESYAWMQYMYGYTQQDDGSWYDTVIPNYFDPADFPFCPDKEDYALYIGRLVRRKGVDIALQVTKELGMPLVIAGQGKLRNPSESMNINNEDNPNVTFLGSVGPEVRKHLMGRAKFAFVPTYYIEPFGGVAVENQMCGTPVLTTDWGVFNETVLHGVTGFRCRTFDDFLYSADNIDKIDPKDCRDWATSNFSIERVSKMYQEYFEKLADIKVPSTNEDSPNGGWYTRHPERLDLEWKHVYYPEGIYHA